MIWTDLFYISSISFIILFVILCVFRFRKNYYLKKFEADELLKDFKEPDARNYIYSTKGITRRYIRRYLIRRGHYDSTIICNYNNNFDYISYYIVAYNRRRKPIQIIEVTETNTKTNSSKIFVLKRRCKYVNIHIKQIDNEVINSVFIKPIPRKKAKLFAGLASLCLFMFLFTVRHLLIIFVGEVLMEIYSNSLFNYVAIGVCLFISLLYFLTTYRTLKRRNFKNRIGGSLDYEFF